MRAFLIVCLVAASVMADSQSVRKSKRGGAKNTKRAIPATKPSSGPTGIIRKAFRRRGQTDLCVGKLKHQPCRTVFFFSEQWDPQHQVHLVWISIMASKRASVFFKIYWYVLTAPFVDPYWFLGSKVTCTGSSVSSLAEKVQKRPHKMLHIGVFVSV